MHLWYFVGIYFKDLGELVQSGRALRTEYLQGGTRTKVLGNLWLIKLVAIRSTWAPKMLTDRPG
jgi:hypothetical protein